MNENDELRTASHQSSDPGAGETVPSLPLPLWNDWAWPPCAMQDPLSLMLFGQLLQLRCQQLVLSEALFGQAASRPSLQPSAALPFSYNNFQRNSDCGLPSAPEQQPAAQPGPEPQDSSQRSRPRKRAKHSKNGLSAVIDFNQADCPQTLLAPEAPALPFTVLRQDSPPQPSHEELQSLPLIEVSRQKERDEERPARRKKKQCQSSTGDAPQSKELKQHRKHKHYRQRDSRMPRQLRERRQNRDAREHRQTRQTKQARQARPPKKERESRQIQSQQNGEGQPRARRRLFGVRTSGFPCLEQFLLGANVRSHLSSKEVRGDLRRLRELAGA